MKFKIIGKLRWYLLFAGINISCSQISAQSFTLKQCIEYGIKNSGNIVNANYDIDIAQRKVNEQIGSALPQINASGSYTDNLQLTTTLLPGTIFGMSGNIPVQMGTKHNVNGGIQLTQKIYDPTFGISLKAAKLSKEQSALALKKTTEQVEYNISFLYYQTMVIKMQLNTLQQITNTSKKLLESTVLRFENGMAKQIDVDKINVSYNNTLSQLNQLELNYKQSLTNLKFNMGMLVDSSIVLIEPDFKFDNKLINSDIANNFFENKTDFQLQKLALKGNELEKKFNSAGYLPNLSFNANYGVNAMRNEFNFFQTGDWYQNSYIGLTLRIPVFDGLQRLSRNNQSKLKIEKSKASINQYKQSIKVELSNNEMQFQNAMDNIQTEQANLNLAENVLRSVQLEYEQGVSTAIDLVQAESSYRESLNNYYNKLLNFYIAQINLENSKGTLTEYLNNLK